MRKVYFVDTAEGLGDLLIKYNLEDCGPSGDYPGWTWYCDNSAEEGAGVYVYFRLRKENEDLLLDEVRTAGGHRQYGSLLEDLFQKELSPVGHSVHARRGLLASPRTPGFVREFLLEFAADEDFFINQYLGMELGIDRSDADALRADLLERLKEAAEDPEICRQVIKGVEEFEAFES